VVGSVFGVVGDLVHDEGGAAVGGGDILGIGQGLAPGLNFEVALIPMAGSSAISAAGNFAYPSIPAHPPREIAGSGRETSTVTTLPNRK
jgi:hypothetical protein